MAALAGSAVTFALLFLMQWLIATARNVLPEETRHPVAEFIEVLREETAQSVAHRPQRPQGPQRAPDMPASDRGGEAVGAVPALAVSAPVADVGLELGAGFGGGGGDGEYVPVVKVAPVYPPEALAQNLSGYVIVEFTVTRAGTVRNVLVVESTSSVFDAAAIDAASRFKYKPRVIDGEPVEVSGVRNKISFVVEQ
jgi:protein TonB